MPLESSHVQKSHHTILDHTTAPEEKDTILKDVRAPRIEISFDLQKDF